MANSTVIVIEYEAASGLGKKMQLSKAMEVLKRQLQEPVKDLDVVQVYAAINEDAEKVLAVVKGAHVDDHDHKPVQHRDGKPPWCNTCKLTAYYQVPKSRLEREA